MVAKDRALVDAAGVHYVAFQLSPRGYAVGITAPGVKLVDLMAANTVTGKSVSLQVKTMTHAKVRSKKDPYWKWWLNEKVDVEQGQRGSPHCVRGFPRRSGAGVSESALGA